MIFFDSVMLKLYLKWANETLRYENVTFRNGSLPINDVNVTSNYHNRYMNY